MRRGLVAVVPEAVLEELQSLLRPTECAQLLSDIVTWFWRTVRSWAASPEDRVRLPQLLQFVTGSARVPVGGFRELVGFNGARHPFTLAKGSHLTPQSLPMAHACICTL